MRYKPGIFDRHIKSTCKGQKYFWRIFVWRPQL